MKLFLSTSLLLSSVAAFAPTQSQMIKTNTALQNDLWGEPPKKEGESEREMSKALPFAPRPKLLDGTLAGDVGFDPFGFSGADKATLLYMREAEIKHSRLAMLAVVGWPLAELLDKPLADALHLETALTKTGASPSILNGGLQKIDNLYWLAVVALAGVVELEIMNQKESKKAQYLPGDVGFDPLGLNPKTQEGKFSMQVKEIKHGRLAMMAILGFVAQEAIFRTPVVAETPIFFHPVF